MINLDMEFKDYYKTLNISFGASDEEIKKSYKQLAKKHHPDSDGGSEEKFKEIQVSSSGAYPYLIPMILPILISKDSKLSTQFSIKDSQNIFKKKLHHILD